jgi:hypothetical protein
MAILPLRLHYHLFDRRYACKAAVSKGIEVIGMACVASIAHHAGCMSLVVCKYRIMALGTGKAALVVLQTSTIAIHGNARGCAADKQSRCMQLDNMLQYQVPNSKTQLKRQDPPPLYSPATPLSPKQYRAQ